MTRQNRSRARRCDSRSHGGAIGVPYRSAAALRRSDACYRPSYWRQRAPQHAVSQPSARYRHAHAHRYRVAAVMRDRTADPGLAGCAGRTQAAGLAYTSQLKARTGRASEAVSKAIDGLVKRGLILVCTEAGAPLNTPEARRRWQGKLFFGLAVEEGELASEFIPEEMSAEVGRIKTGSVSEIGEALSGPVPHPSSSQTELRLPNTTKAVQDTILPSDTAQGKPIYGNRSVKWPGGVQTEEEFVQHRQPQPVHPVSEAAEADIARFLGEYQECFARRSARGETPPIQWERDSRLVRSLLAQYGYQRLLELLDAFFHSDDPWVYKCGYALSGFPSLLPRLLMQKPDQRRSQQSPPSRYPSNGMGHRQSGSRGFRGDLVDSGEVIQSVCHSGISQTWARAGEKARAEGPVPSDNATHSLFERYPDLKQRLRENRPRSPA